jgi:hypothetical protein
MPDDFATDPPADDLFPSHPAATGEEQGGDENAGGAIDSPPAPAPEPEKPKRRTRARLTEAAKPKGPETAGMAVEPSGDRPTVAQDLAAENDRLRGELDELKSQTAGLRARLTEPRGAEPADAGDDSLALYECHMPADKTVKPVRVRAKTPGDAKEKFLEAIGAFATENEIKVREVG